MVRVVKVSYKDDIRRIAVDDSISFGALLILLKSRFGLATARVSYVDEDNDVITIGSDEEVQEAFRLVLPPGAVRLFVTQGDEDPSFSCGVSMQSEYDVVSASSSQRDEDEQQTSASGDDEDDARAAAEELDEEPLPQLSTSPERSASCPAVEEAVVEEEVKAVVTETEAVAVPVAEDDAALAATAYPALSALYANAPLAEAAVAAAVERLLPALVKTQERMPQVAAAMQASLHKTVAAVTAATLEFASTMAAEAAAASEAAAQRAAAAAASTPAPASPSATAPRSLSDVVVHPHVICDGCEISPIAGPRFKCAICPDFDLCEACEARGVHPYNHPMLKLRVPFQHVSISIFNDQADAVAACQADAVAAAPAEEGEYADVDVVVAADVEEEVVEVAAVVEPHLFAIFIEDVTVPDGARFRAGTPFRKIWRFRNGGDSAWPAATQLTCVEQGIAGAPQMAGAAAVTIGTEVAPNAFVDIAVDLVAPQEPGRYVTFWRLSCDNEPFGHRVWVDINVDAPVTRAEDLYTPAELQLIQMGFDIELVRNALTESRGDLRVAANMLLG